MLFRFDNLSLLSPGKKIGKGRDVKYGMLRAQGEVVMFMDADMATPLRYIETFLKAYKRGHEIVVATRNLKRHHPGFLRRAVSNAGNLLYKVLGGVWIEDSQCGFKLFSSRANRICFERMTILGWGFDMELLAIAHANNITIKSYRVNDWVSVPEGTFFEGVVSSSIESLRELFIIFINRVRGAYKVN